VWATTVKSSMKMNSYARIPQTSRISTSEHSNLDHTATEICNQTIVSLDKKCQEEAHKLATPSSRNGCMKW
jgi:hypothetical protein